MHRRLSAIAMAFVLVLSACGDENPAKPQDSGGTETATIFPLSVGNVWTYNCGSDSVKATATLDGKEYYVMEGTSLKIAGMPAYVRMNDQGQLLVRRQREPYGEHVLFDFGAELGGQWRYLPPFADTLHYATVKLVSCSDSTVVPAGKFKDCYEFHFDAIMTDSDWYWLISPGTGVVHFGGGYGFDCKLVEFVEGER